MGLFDSKLGMLIASALAMSENSLPKLPKKHHYASRPLPKDVQKEKIRLAEEKRARKAAKRVKDAAKKV